MQRPRRRWSAASLLDRIVDTTTSNKDVWIAIMMAEELRLQPVDRRAALFAVGVYKSLTTVGRWWLGRLEMCAIGMAAAAIGYAVGLAFR